jgi:hypothetical protein
MSYPTDVNNELVKLKAALNDLEKKKKSTEYSNFPSDSKKLITDMEKATSDLFKILSKLK